MVFVHRIYDMHMVFLFAVQDKDIKSCSEGRKYWNDFIVPFSVEKNAIKHQTLI